MEALYRADDPMTRYLLLLLGGLSLLAGLDAALLLSALPAPVRSERLPDVHGMLMVLGFLGTLVALERAVAIRHPWGYLAPGLLGAGGLALLTPAPILLGQLLLLDGCLLLIGVYAALWGRAHDPVVLVQLVAAVAAACAGLLWPQPDARLLGLVLLVGTLWLARYDVARHTIRLTGLPRFSAVALLLGYGWLVVAALTWLVGGPPTLTPAYDTVVHAVFLGFAMSMVLAHAPIILPAVLRIRLPYRPVLWLPLVLLHTALLVRVGGGNALGYPLLWQVGAAGTVLALLLLPLTAGSIAVRSRRTVESPHRAALHLVRAERGNP